MCQSHYLVAAHLLNIHLSIYLLYVDQLTQLQQPQLVLPPHSEKVWPHQNLAHLGAPQGLSFMAQNLRVCLFLKSKLYINYGQFVRTYVHRSIRDSS